MATEMTSSDVAMVAETGGDNNSSNDKNSNNSHDDPVETFLFQNLQSGFRSIRRRRSSTLPSVAAIHHDDKIKDDVKSSTVAAGVTSTTKTVLVNFIDPSSVSGSIVAATTAAAGTTAATATNAASQTPPRQPPPSINRISLYQRLATIFERDYQNTLQQLPYQDVLRSKALNIIHAITIQTVLSPGVFLSDDVLARLSKNANHGQGNTNMNNKSNSNNMAATHWHEGPYCNVYLAACESLEEYRTKVKPSVQAFVSQIESTNKDGAYVIVYCPNTSSTNSNKSTSALSSSLLSGGGGDYDGKSGGAATLSSASRVGSLANRIRQRMGRDTSTSNNTNSPATNSSTHSAGNSASSPATNNTSSSSAASGSPGLTDSVHSGTGASTNSTELSVDTAEDETNNNNSTSTAVAVTNSSISTSSRAGHHLTKVQKELVRRFAADFSNGHVCTLSTLFCDGGGVDDVMEASSPLQKLEWSHFTKALGKAVVEGFQERCRRFDEVLRKMDAQRGGGGVAPKGGSTTADSVGASTAFNLSQFFLIKESLAFTYEQMNLPAEALLQYNELRALLPDIRTDKDLEVIQGGPNDGDLLSGIEGAETHRRRSSMSGSTTSGGGGVGGSASDDQMSQLATASDIVAFRQRLRDITDLRIIAPAIEEYIYGREVSLLFQIGDPVEVIRRSLHFVSALFNFRSNQIKNLSDNARRERSIELERWAFKFCWDLKRAADSYLGVDVIEDTIAATEQARKNGIEARRESQASWPAPSMVTIGNEVTSGALSSGLEKRPKASMETFARHVCDVMGYARLRLIRLADLVLADNNIMTRLGFEAVPADVRKPWPPWSAPSSEPPSPPNKHGIRNLRSGESFLEDAFESKESFQSRFLDVMKVAIALNTFAGRYRCAARLNLDAVEIFLRRGEIHEAVHALQKIAAVYARDQWMGCNFLLLFRLAGFQRQIGSPREYLTTLIQCFHGHAAAPPKALEALQTDLEAVATTEWTSGVAFPDPPLFAPVLGLRDQRQMPGATGRKLVRKEYNVGDHAGILLALTSHLPRNINDVTIKVDLVPYHVYVSCMEDSVPISQEHVSQTLSLGGSVVLQPGKNDYVFEWTPISSGQYIVAMIEIEWKGIQFNYKSREVLKPTIRVDILPREPTQSIQAKPVFLLPGHEQPVRIEFSSGSDVVERGELQLACSTGLVILPPGEDRTNSEKWCSMVTMDLPSCPPGETVVLATSVRSSSDPDDDDDSPLTVHAKVTTQYQYFPPDVSDGNVKEQVSACSENVLETVLTTLEHSALSVSDVHLTTYAFGRSLLGVSLKCHTPTPFVLKSWKLTLPSYLVLDESPFAVDMNASLVDTMIVDHDQVNFGFHCKHCTADHSKSTHASLVVDVQDEFGSLFSERLEIRMARISMPKTELPNVQSVSIKIQPSSKEAIVGSSIELDYVVDTTVFAGWKGRVSYSVDTDSDDWFVSGNIQGVVDISSSFTLSLVAIPTRPGVSKRFPTLSLSLDEEGLEKPVRLTVVAIGEDGTHCRFHALAPPVSSSVAFLERVEV